MISRSACTSLLVACAAALGAACSGDASFESPPNVVLVLVDTLRVDAATTFGGERDAMPFVDELAERSFVFHDAIAPSSWTSPSVASLFTSRLPSRHGITGFASILGAKEFTLAEALSARGWATGGFSANWLIRAELGYGQGFGRFEARRGVGPPLQRVSERAEQTTTRALEWIDGLPAGEGKPFFLYLHWMNPHTPYHPPASALAWAFEGRPTPDMQRLNAALLSDHGHASRTPDREATRAAYRAEVRSVDDALRALCDGLEKRGRLADALVVFVADHGEEFWEHGGQGHNHSLWDEVIHVPLLIHLPGQRSRVDVRESVSLVDVAPTLLEWLDLPIPPSFEGRSLRDALDSRAGGLLRRSLVRLRGAPAIAEPVVSEHLQPPVMRKTWGHERAVVKGRHKLIADIDGKRRFFAREGLMNEIPADDLDPAIRGELEDALDAFGRAGREAATATRAKMSEATRDELRSLGYLE